MQSAIIGAIISALGFGTANVVIKKALSNTSIPQTLLSSMLSGAFFLFWLVLFKGFPHDITPQLLITLSLFAVGEVSLYLSLYKAFEAADVTVASGIISIYPILSTLITVFVFHESITLSKVFFIILLVVGAILISIDYSTFNIKKLSRNSFMKGLPWAILCLCFHAVYFPLLGNLTASGNWEFKLLGIKIGASILLFVIFGLIRKSKFLLTKKRVLAGTVLGLLEVIGWIGLSFASSSSTGFLAIIIALGSSAPLVTALIARIFLHEKLHLMQYLGIITVVLGLTLIAIV